MADVERNETEWRQGDVLSDAAAKALSLESPAGTAATVVVMVTHDCDIAGSIEREPQVEVIIGTQIAALGVDTNAKTARRLHVSYRTDDGDVPVELLATEKRYLPKTDVLAASPREGWLARSASRCSGRKTAPPIHPTSRTPFMLTLRWA